MSSCNQLIYCDWHVCYPYFVKSCGNGFSNLGYILELNMSALNTSLSMILFSNFGVCSTNFCLWRTKAVAWLSLLIVQVVSSYHLLNLEYHFFAINIVNPWLWCHRHIRYIEKGNWKSEYLITSQKCGVLSQVNTQEEVTASRLSEGRYLKFQVLLTPKDMKRPSERWRGLHKEETVSKGKHGF